jgi:hypothetical protein
MLWSTDSTVLMSKITYGIHLVIVVWRVFSSVSAKAYPLLASQPIPWSLIVPDFISACTNSGIDIQSFIRSSGFGGISRGFRCHLMENFFVISNKPVLSPG